MDAQRGRGHHPTAKPWPCNDSISIKKPENPSRDLRRCNCRHRFLQQQPCASAGRAGKQNFCRFFITDCSKRLLAAWKAARKRGEDEKENEWGWRAKRDGSLPRDHACRRQHPCPAGSSARPHLRSSAAYLSPTSAANSNSNATLDS